MPSQGTLCAILAMVVGTTAIQIAKDVDADQWSPLDILRSDSVSPETSSDVKKGTQKGAHALGLKVGKLSSANKADSTKPRMLVHSGCDASEAVMEHAHAILALYGIQTPQDKLRTLHDNVSQILVAKRSLEKIGEKDAKCGESCRAMVQTQTYFQGRNQSLLFKGNIAEDHEAILSKTVHDMRPLVALLARRNKLDQVVCMVKDCYLKHQNGYPVVDNEQSHICWERRQKEPKGYKAFVKPNKLMENINRLEEREVNAEKELRENGYSVESVYSEDLLDFEWNAKAVGPALKAWAPVLSAWGVHDDEHDSPLEAYLQEKAGKLHPQTPHRASISNFADIKKVLQGRDKYTWMVRE